MLGACRGLLPSVLVCLAVLAAASPAAAQFVSPPPPAPILPPNFSQRQMQKFQAPVQLGQRCATSAGICSLNGAYPLGSPCNCLNPAGPPISGSVIR